jgi:intracellular multiplication protein IcmJ
MTIALGIGRGARSASASSTTTAAGLPGNGKTPHAVLSAEQRQKLYERDGYACRFCGFKSQKYQDIHFVNGNSADMRPENMATACIFCHQCFNLDQVGAMRSGVLVWLPEIEQTALHHIARAIYVARISQGPVAEAARRALDVLMQRREDAKRRLATDDPQILATVMRDYITEKTYEMRDKKLEGLRLFPLDRRIIKEADLEFNQFPQILAYWRSKDGPFGGQQPKDWTGLYREIDRAA